MTIKLHPSRSTAALVLWLLNAACLPSPPETDECSWYADNDGDGYGDPESPWEAPCYPTPAGYTDDHTDCDDADPKVHPGHPEICDGRDNDCDGSTNELADVDQDGFSLCDGDCDDALNIIGPMTVEICDGMDNDCDGVVDDDCLACTDNLNPADDLQQAIDGAAYGDVLCLASGSYEGALEFGDGAVSMVGLYGAGITFLQGASEQSTVRFIEDNEDSAILDGFTVTGGHTSKHGGGIYLQDASPSLRHLIVEDNEAPEEDDGGKGGGIYANRGAPNLQDVVIRDNYALKHGGGVFLDASDATLTRVEIYQNTVSLDIGHSGGGLCINNASPILVGVLVHDNTSYRAGGINISQTSDPTFTNVAVYDNSAQGKGGGIYVDSSLPTFTNILLLQNQSIGQGGGLFMEASSAKLTNAVFAANSSDGNGGGISAIDTGLYIIQATFVRNAGGDSGGALSMTGESTLTSINSIFFDNQAYAGGGLYLDMGNTNPSIEYCSFHANIPEDYQGPGDPAATDSNTFSAPGLLDVTDPDAWLWQLQLAANSTLINMGDPSIQDPDGGLSDPGAFGGEEADGWDLDLDGYPSWWQPGEYDDTEHPQQGLDCDDRNRTVYPGAGC